jgi:PII-like signaling protein
VNEDSLKLTIYFGERDRAGSQFLADALAEIYARRELQASIVMRGVEGFGVKHHLHTDRLLTLSEDLPLVSVAVDGRSRIEAALPEVNRLHFDGLVTLEWARMLSGTIQAVPPLAGLHEATKVTVYVGRHDRAGGKPSTRRLLPCYTLVG